MTTAKPIMLFRTATGEAPLALVGHVRATVRTDDDGPTDRWYEVNAYEVVQSQTARWAIAIDFRTERNNEAPLAWAWRDTDLPRLAATVSAWARTHDIAEYLTGFPGGDQFAAKRDHTARALRISLLRALAVVLGDIGATEKA